MGQRDIPNKWQFMSIHHEARSFEWVHTARPDILPKCTECVPNQAEVGDEKNDPNRIDDAITFERESASRPRDLRRRRMLRDSKI